MGSNVVVQCRSKSDVFIKEKKLMLAVNGVISDPERTLELMKIIKAQSEY